MGTDNLYRRQRLRRGLALGTAAVLAATMLTGCRAKEEETISSAELDEMAEDVQTFFGTDSHSATDGRVETVYALAGAEGQVEQTIVSVQLKNGQQQEELTDFTILQDVENVKGDETYTRDGDGNLIWAAGGSDIYYQGTTNEALPVSVNIAYELDGMPISGNELEGAEGRITMKISYENSQSQQVTVGETEETLFMPYLMLTGMMLDHEKVSNLEVTGGKVIDDGDHYVVVGYGMPGLADSLKLGEKEKDLEELDLGMKFNDTVEISADVKDFSGITTLTVADNSFLKDLDLDTSKLTEKMDESMSELTEGSEKLVDGSKELYGYLGDLSKGTIDLNSGARTIANNMGDLVSGLNSLDSGSTDLYNGVKTLKGKVKDLPEGVDKLLGGVQSVRKGVKSGDAAKPGIYEGAAAIAQGAGALQDGAKSIASYAGSSSSDSSTDAYHLAGAIDGGLSQMESALAALPQAAAGAGDALDSSEGYLNSALSILNSVEMDEETRAKIQGCIGASIQYQDGVKSALGGLSVDTSGIGQMHQAAKGIQQIAEGISSGAGELAKGAKQVQSGASTIEQGADTLYGDSALGLIEGGLKEMSGSSKTLMGAMDTLEAGAGKISSGTHTAAVGAGKLKAGSEELAKGTKTLTEGASDILKGAGELRDGICKLDEEGIQKLADVLGDDLSGFTDRMDALKKLAEGYQSFAGRDVEGDASVRFIIRTGK